MDREEAAFKWNLWSWTQNEIWGGKSTGELEATDKLDRSFFWLWETCRKEAVNRSLVCSENFKQLVEWLAPSCEWTKANLSWTSKWRSMTIRYSKTDLWKIFQATLTVWMFLTILKWQLQKYKWANGNLKYQPWSHLSSMTLSPSILPKSHQPYCLKRLSACLLCWLPHYWSLATSDPPQSWQSQWPTLIVCICIWLCLYL